jgi:hypothetical protein
VWVGGWDFFVYTTGTPRGGDPRQNQWHNWFLTGESRGWPRQYHGWGEGGGGGGGLNALSWPELRWGRRGAADVDGRGAGSDGKVMAVIEV